jgi:AcrR family transcriptional regulator
MNTRLQPDARKAQIIDGALEAARSQGLAKLTRENIAAHVNVSPALVSRYLGTMTELRRTLMRAAIKREILEIIAEGIATRDKIAARVPEELKRRALSTLKT